MSTKGSLLMGAIWLALLPVILPPVPVQGVEVPLTAAVTVVSPSEDSFGAGVHSAHRSQDADGVLGEPEGEDAVLWPGGQITVELERTVAEGGSVSVWAAQAGWGSSGFVVYVSEDARGWKRVGSASCGSEYVEHHFGGDYGTVRFVRVARTGGWFALVLLDAVSARRG